MKRFTLLGLPPRAVKLTGVSSGFAVSSAASVAAASPTLSETLVTVGNRSQLSVIRGDWAIQRTAVVAQDGQATFVAVDGGAFRVDVGEGQHFLCSPRKLVGTLGQVRSTLVYDETRFDVLQAWSRLIWSTTVSYARSSYRAVRRALSRIPLPAALSSIRAPKLPQLPQLPPAAQRWAQITKDYARKTANVVSDRTFHYTHPPKLRIEGPCSVLVKS